MGFNTDIIHGRILGISLNIPAKVLAFCPPVLFVCNEKLFLYIWSNRLGWVEIST